jgi:hypothetical protein
MGTSSKAIFSDLIRMSVKMRMPQKPYNVSVAHRATSNPLLRGFDLRRRAIDVGWQWLPMAGRRW